MSSTKKMILRTVSLFHCSRSSVLELRDRSSHMPELSAVETSFARIGHTS